MRLHSAERVQIPGVSVVGSPQISQETRTGPTPDRLARLRRLVRLHAGVLLHTPPSALVGSVQTSHGCQIVAGLATRWRREARL